MTTVEFLNKLRRNLERSEEKWVLPEVVDDAEEMIGEYHEFIVSTLKDLRSITN